MVGQMLMELARHCSFQDLTEERKVGDRPKVFEVISVQTRLLQNGSDGGDFKTGGHCTGGYGVVDYVSDDRTEARKAGFNQSSCHGVQRTGGGFGFGDQFGNQCSGDRGEREERAVGGAGKLQECTT